MHGFFENNRLYLNLNLLGFLKKDGKIIKAHVDTGYDGELTMPFQEAFPYGFALIGTKTYSLADGSNSVYFSCLGKIEINGKSEEVFIDVIQNCSILVGMGLLPKLCKEMQISFVNNQLVLKP